MSFPGSVLLGQWDIVQQHTNQALPLGTRGYTRDGRAFRYAKASGTIKKGRLVTAAAVTAAWSDDQRIETTAKTSGTTSIKLRSVSSENATGGIYDEGYVFVNDGTGQGMILQIDHQGWSSQGDTRDYISTLTFLDEGTLTTKISSGANTEIGLVKNLYKDVVEAPKAIVSIPVGVALTDIATGKYFWLQTWGIAPVRSAYSSRNQSCAGWPTIQTAGTDTGTVGALDSNMQNDSDFPNHWLQPRIGTCVEVGANDEVGLTDLHLAP